MRIEKPDQQSLHMQLRQVPDLLGLSGSCMFSLYARSLGENGTYTDYNECFLAHRCSYIAEQLRVSYYLTVDPAFNKTFERFGGFILTIYNESGLELQKTRFDLAFEKDIEIAGIEGLREVSEGGLMPSITYSYPISRTKILPLNVEAN